ncbi:MAG TPA: M56 family metallopeptidase, partial [Enhygromyxa sp.]|nr:M56 family metallopeptidase [Enhygromyxa sp.]
MSLSALALWIASLQLAGAGVLGLAAIVDRLLRRRSAATRRSVWALAIMLAATLPLARLLLPAPALALPQGLAIALIGLWAIGVALLGICWLHGIALTRRIIAASVPIDAGPWRHSLAALESHIGAIELRTAVGIPGPMLAGGVRPILLIPAELELPSASERRSILTHELAHLCRADNPFLHLGVIVRAIYWINPLAWWSLRRLRETAELAADDAVLEDGATPASYAAQLVASARAQLDRTDVRLEGGEAVTPRARVDRHRCRDDPS